MTIDRDGAERLVREAAERHHMDPALVRAVIETESGWNATAKSRKGALGLMQLIPTTAVRFGVNDAFSPQQNVDAGVRYLKTLLERYNGNLDLALAAYNAGEGAVDRAHGVPAFRETRDYVQKVQNAYFRPGSGRMEACGRIRTPSAKSPIPPAASFSPTSKFVCSGHPACAGRFQVAKPQQKSAVGKAGCWQAKIFSTSCSPAFRRFSL